FAVSKWETGRDTPSAAHVEALCSYFDKPAGYFHDPTEQEPIAATIILGHQASFTQSAPAAQNAQRSILVFQTGGSKAPSWWREGLRDHLIEMAGAVHYRIVLCIDPERVTPELVQHFDRAAQEFEGTEVDLNICEQKPQLGIDIMIVDRLHVFMGLQAHSLQNRKCSIHFESEAVASALSEWLLTACPIIDYRRWRAKYEGGPVVA
ncbi:MAG: hypothetical protein ACREFK_19410, partial [Stellaceae bacterium]